MKRTILFFPLLILFFPSLMAGGAEELFAKANEAYQNGDYGQAIQLYEEVKVKGFRSAELEYNLGNAHYKNGEMGRAVLHYERALLLSPHDEDAEYNLQLLREEMEVRKALPDFFLLAWWKNARNSLPISVWAMIGVVLWWLGFAGLFLWQLGKTRRLRKQGFLGGVVALLVSLLPFALAFSGLSYQSDNGYAIVMAKNAVLKSAPDEVGTVILPLKEGEKVEMLEYLGGYWQVRLSNGEKGWVDDDEVEEI